MTIYSLAFKRKKTNTSVRQWLSIWPSWKSERLWIC